MTHGEQVQRAIDAFNATAPTEDFYGRKSKVYARKPILATDCDYEIVRISGVQGMRLKQNAKVKTAQCDQSPKGQDGNRLDGEATRARSAKPMRPTLVSQQKGHDSE